MLLMIDNYDNFTFNLVSTCRRWARRCRVERNDALTVDEIERTRAGAHRHFARPVHAERSRRVDGDHPRLGARPILGVCLGRRASARPMAATWSRRADHARQDLAHRHEGKGVFAGLPDGYEVTRATTRWWSAKRTPGEPPSHRLDRERGRLDRGDHGPAPSRNSGRGRAVPPRVDPDRARACAAEEFPGAMIFAPLQGEAGWDGAPYRHHPHPNP